MPLPAEQTTWPPVQLQGVTEKIAEWDAWYTGDTGALAGIYGSGPTPSTTKSVGWWRGMFRRARNWFVGSAGDSSSDAAKDAIHVNLAQEIARTSANLLFSESVTATTEESKAQERLALICGPEFNSTMVMAGETCSALGGVFIRASWDRSVEDHAFVTKVDTDQALPVFSHGRLKSVAFWRALASDSSTVWRHVESHDVVNGIGIITHGLYEGTDSNIGRLIPLTERPETALIAVDEDSSVSTLSPGLSAVYVPNELPSAVWRKHPIGASLGRSDLEGIEEQLDALDELHSTWLRDIRLGKGRLIVPESMLDIEGVGGGASFDLDKSIFTPVAAAMSSGLDEKMTIEKVQFEIRTEDFLAAIEYFKRAILSSAGYSPQTFGIVDDGAAITATEVVARERATYMTRDRKIRGFQPPLQRILSKVLAVDAAVFETGVTDTAVTVTFADAVQPDLTAISQQNSLDYASQSASMRTRVARMHPDWTDTQIDKEVAAIKGESQAAGQAPVATDDPSDDAGKATKAPVAA